MSEQDKRSKIKVAWVLNSSFYYWQPLIAHFAEIWSNTKLFTVDWQGYLAGYEDSFELENLGTKKLIYIKRNLGGYDYNIGYLPLNIINKLRRYKPQVILSNSFGLWTILVLLFKPIYRWRVIVLHEGSSPNVDYQNSWWRLALRRAMMKATDACLTNGSSGRDFLVKVLQMPPEKVFVYPYPLPSLKSFAEVQQISELKDLPHPIFLCVGQVIARKGLDFLLQAAALLEAEGNLDYRIVMLGDGADKQKLMVYCEANNLSQKVLWLGKVEYNSLPGYFQAADVFILPTLEDVWAVVALEAMTAGKAILCSQFAGAVETIADGENGYIFDPRNVKELSGLMRKFIEQPELIDKMGARSLEIMHEYTPENAAKLLTKAIDFVLPSALENS